MHRQVGRAYGDLVLPVSSRDLRNLTEPPRCGPVQYPTGTEESQREGFVGFGFREPIHS
jgi:hypothetical protein